MLNEYVISIRAFYCKYNKTEVKKRLITEITAPHPSPALFRLLSYAASQRSVEVYKEYLESADRQLFSCILNNQLVGCIGIERNGQRCTIKHIAVVPESRGKGVGSGMIKFLLINNAIEQIIAETDKEAVAFYRKFGFSVSSLGEKYPGVERFHCCYSLK